MRILRLILVHLSVLLLIIGSFSCKKDQSSIDSSDASAKTTKKILFQYDYCNYAWGATGYGWFIDSSGYVKEYQSWNTVTEGYEHIDWEYCDSLGYISSSGLELDYNQTDTVVYQVDVKELKKMMQLITTISDDSLSGDSTTKNDAGTAAFCCYYWDSSKKAYKQVLLAQTGDVEKHNKSANAILLTNWLIETGKKTNKFFWLTFN
jgi:hypothetical protein